MPISDFFAGKYRGMYSFIMLTNIHQAISSSERYQLFQTQVYLATWLDHIVYLIA